MAVKNYQAVITANDLVADKTHRMRLRLEDGESFEFRAGQFMNLQVAPTARRSYSISSSPLNKDYLETYADTHAGGPGSKFFESAVVGQEVSLLGPLGSFFYEEREKPVFFIATGTGCTPFISMIRYALEEVHSERQIIMISGFRFAGDYFADDIFNEMQSKFSNFKYYLTLSKPEADWKGFKGRVTERLELVKSKDVDAYICCSQAMINDTEAILLNKGVPSSQVFYEQFY